MLKNEKIVVEVEGFSISEILVDEAAKFRDGIAEKHTATGRGEFSNALQTAVVVKRITSWPLADECNDENKEIFYTQFTEKCISILDAADEKIKKKREELLGNLLSGASGT